MRAQRRCAGAGSMLVAGLIACAPAQVPAQAHGLTSHSPELMSEDSPPGATLDGLLAAARQLSPALRAASLETEAVAARVGGADALDDPTITDSYQYYKDPNAFSAHTVMLTQSFPLWGKRGLRRQSALADLDAARGRQRAAQDALEERIKVAYARYELVRSDEAVNREVADLARRMRAAAAARFGQGYGDQTAVIEALGEETNARIESARLQGESDAARARLNALVGRPGDAPLGEPSRMRPIPAEVPPLATLVDRARAANPSLSAGDAAVTAARSRRALADKGWYPDVTVGAGPLIQTNDRPVGFAATIGFNIPVSWGREASGQQEAAAQLGAARQRYDAAFQDIEGAIGEAVARLHAARATEALVRREAMPQARAMFQTVLTGYSQGKGDLAAAITAEHRIHETELLLLQTQLDEQVALAALERLLGGAL